MFEEEAYTVEDLAKVMGVGRSTVGGMLRAGILPYVVADGKYKIPKESFHSRWEGLLGDMDEIH